MANHKSAKKRARQTVKRTVQNKVHKSKFKTILKRLRGAISEGKKDEAQTLLKNFQSTAARLETKGILKKNNAARKTSRLSSQVSKLA